MKAKTLLTYIIVAVLTIALSVGGTLAFLTDRESIPNTFTVGDVRIEIEEDFEQGSQLMPDLDINKDVRIKNVGANSAWVFYTYAIPSALDTPGDASGNILHVNHAGANWLGYQDNQKYWAEGQTAATPADQCWIVDYIPGGENGSPYQVVDVNGIDYNVYVVLYNGLLSPGEITTVGMTNVYLDRFVDIHPDGQVYRVENGNAVKVDWNIKDNTNTVIFVNAYAVQAEEFGSVQAAFNAYIGQWGGLNGSMIMPGRPNVLNIAEMNEAMMLGWDKIVVAQNITLTGDVLGTYRVGTSVAENVILDLNGKTIKNDSMRTNGTNNILFNVANTNMTITGNGKMINTPNNEPGLIFAGKDAVLTIENGYFDGGKHYAIWAGQNSKVYIKGGTFLGYSEMLYANSTACIEITGGTFINTGTGDPFNIKDWSGGRIIVKGGTYVNFDPSHSQEGNRVAAGYKVISEEKANGDMWYIVVPE